MSGSNLYPGGDNPVTVNLGLSLWGMDEVVAENFITIDAAFAGGTGVTSLNSLTGALTIAAGTGISVTPLGSTITITNTQSAATPGGSSGAIQYNNAGVFGGSAATITAAGSIVLPDGQTVSDGIGNKLLFLSAGVVLIDAAGDQIGVDGGQATVADSVGDFVILGGGINNFEIASNGGTATIKQPTGGSVISFHGSEFTFDAGIVLNGATGGNEGLGTLNATGLYINGVPVGTGSGTVTSFSAGNLSPLFSTSVSTATTTPALSFSLSNAAQNAVLAGPSSGGSGAPTYRALVASDLPAGTGTVTSVSFTGGLISVATPTTTPALTVAGTSGGIPYFSSASTWASSAVLPAGDFVLGGGAGAAPTASFSVVPVANGGTGTGSTLTGIVRGGNPFTASELSGDISTSGSNVTTLATVNSNVGSFAYASITVNAKGLITAASSGAAPGTVTSVAQTFTGGLISVSGSPITTSGTLALTVAGTSGGIPYFSGTSTWASSALLASGGLVIGGGAGTAPLTNTQLTFSAPTLTVGLAGTSSGILALTGSTSGSATFTAPAVAGTTSNAVVSSNNITAPVFNATTGFTIGGAAASGNYLRGNGTDFVSSAIQSGDVTWNSLGNATGNLTLSNAGNATTFNQTSAVIWTWANTTAATSGTAQSSPILELAGTYWNGSASAVDDWTIEGVPGNGTNPVSILTIGHAGSSGNTYVGLNGLTGLQLNGATQAIDLGANTSWTLNFTNTSGTTTNGVITGAANAFAFQAPTGTANQANIQGHVTTSNARPSVLIANQGATMNATSGSQVVLQQSGLFGPGSGSASFISCNIIPTIQGTSSGNTTALVVNPTLTATNLTGTNLIVDFQSGGTSEFNVDYSGNVKQQGLEKVYNGITTVANGLASLYAQVNSTGLTANVASTTLYAVPAAGAGFYRVSAYIVETTAATTSSVSPSVVLGWKDETGTTQSSTIVAGGSTGNAVGTFASGSFVVYSEASQNITYSTTGYTSVGATSLAYSLRIRMEALG